MVVGTVKQSREPTFDVHHPVGVRADRHSVDRPPQLATSVHRAAAAPRTLVDSLLVAESEADRVEAGAAVCPRSWTWAAVRGAALDEPQRRLGAHGASGSAASASLRPRPRSAAEIADRSRSVNPLRGFPSLRSVTARLRPAGVRPSGDAARRRFRSEGGLRSQQRE